MGFKDFINEDRKVNLSYQEKAVKGIIDRVTVELDGHESAVMSKLAKKYITLDTAIKKMTEKRNALNVDVKTKTEALFNAEDIMLTRVIETAMFTLTLSKLIKAGEDKKITDYESVARELAKLIPMELNSKIQEIIATYTSIKKENDRTPSLTIKQKTNEGVSEWIEKIKNFVANIKSWAKGFDKKLAELKRKV